MVCLSWRVGGCPEGDASSRWLIDIRTDLFPPTTMIAVRSARVGRAESDPLGRTRAPDRPDRSVRSAMGRGQSDRCSRAAASAISTSDRLRRNRTVAAAGPPPWMQRAPANGSDRQSRRSSYPTRMSRRRITQARTPGLSESGLSEPGLSERRASAASLRGPARRRRPSRSYHEAAALRRQPMQRARSVALRRCAVRPARHRRSRTISAIRPIRTIPTPIRTAMMTATKSEQPQKRRGGMMTVPPCWRWRWSEPARRSPIAPMSDRPAAASRRSSGPTTARPRSCRRRPTATPRLPDRMAAGDGGEKLVSARRSAGRRQCQVGGPRVVFPPLNPERQPAAGRERGSVAPAAGQRRQRHHAEQRAAQDQDARRQGRPAGWRRDSGRRRRRPAKPAPPTRDAAAAARHASRAPMPPLPPMPAPMRRCRWHRSRKPAPQPSRDPGRLPPIRRRPRHGVAPSGGGYPGLRSPRSGTRPTRRPPSGRCRASSRRCSDRIRR